MERFGGLRTEERGQRREERQMKKMVSEIFSYPFLKAQLFEGSEKISQAKN